MDETLEEEMEAWYRMGAESYLAFEDSLEDNDADRLEKEETAHGASGTDSESPKE